MKKVVKKLVKYTAVTLLILVLGLSNGLSNLFYTVGLPKIGEDLKIKEAYAETATLRPSADGFRAEWTNNGCAANWECVDEVTSDDDTTFVSTSSNNTMTSYNFPDGLVPSGSTISNVAVSSVAKRTQAGAAIQNVVVWGTGGAQFDGKGSDDTSATNWSLTGAYVTNTNNWALNPNGGAAWTVADIDALNAGVITKAAKATSVTQVWVVVTYTPPGATTIRGDGVDPANSTVAPGSATTTLDNFDVRTSSGSDTITALTVTLSPTNATTVLSAVTIAQVENGNASSTIFNPTSNVLNFTGLSLSVISTATTTYFVRIVPKIHFDMPLPPGSEIGATGTVTAMTTTNSQSGTDTDSATITIDNLSPNGATLVSGSAGDGSNTINWTTSTSTDFDTTNGSVIYRWQAASAGSETPDEGITPSVGSADGTATVACVISSATSTALSKVDGTGGSAGCTTVALTNGQAYTYKAFQRDTRGNYDVGVLIGTFTPTAGAPNITVGTEGTQANMVIGIGDNNVGGVFSFTRNTGSANVTRIIISDTGTVNANLNISDVVIFFKQEATCSTSIPVDATQFNSAGVGFDASENATTTGTMAVGTSKICVYVRVDVGDGATDTQTLEIEISNPSTEVTVSAGTVSPATVVAIAGTTTLNLPAYTSRGIPFLYTSANWGTDGAGVSFFLEVYMRQTTGTVYARLLNETDTTAVTGSTLSTTSASFTRLRTASGLTLVNGKTYRVQFGKIGADAGETLGGKLVVNQNNKNGGGGGGSGTGVAEILEVQPLTGEDSTPDTGRIQAIVKSVLNSLGLFIENGVAKFMDLTARTIVVERLEVKEAVIENAQIANLEVSRKIKLRDFITNELYCAWIELGEWKKERCDTKIIADSEQTDTQENQDVESASQESATSTTIEIEGQTVSSEL